MENAIGTVIIFYSNSMSNVIVCVIA